MNVLLLGRESETRQSINHMLTARGHNVIMTDNRDIFWAAFIRDVFPMIFLDLSISGYPDLELCRRIRSMAKGSQSLIVQYGLRGQDVHADVLIDAGVDEYLRVTSGQQEDLDNRIILIEHRAQMETIHRQATAATKTVYERLFAHIDASPLAVLEWDQELRAQHWSQGAVRLLGWKASDVVGKSVMDWPFVDPQDTSDIFHSLSALIDGPNIRASSTSHNLTSTGETIVVEWHTSVLRNASGQYLSAVSFGVNITQREQAIKALQFGEHSFRSLVQNAPDILLTLDAEGIIGYVSPSMERTFGHTTGLILGRTIFEFIHDEDRSRIQELLTELAGSPGMTAPGTEFRLLHHDGSWRYVEASISNPEGDPAPTEMIAVARDISERKQLERRLTRQAFSDSLTGLPNRALFLNRLGHALARIERSTTSIAVLFLDLDRFKSVNDSLGHHVGDALLAALGRVLREHVRPGDTVARLAGDEFTMLLEDLDSPLEAARVAERILSVLRHPIPLIGHEVFVTASIGIAFATPDTRTVEELMRNADAALYRAKATGKGRYVVFDESMAGQAVERLTLESELRHALTASELELHYQPEVDLNTGHIAGFEALLRWRHPDRGILYPDQFLGVAVESGLILPIGHWVLSEACRFAATWRVAGLEGPLSSVGVNLSEQEFQQPDLVQLVRSVLAQTRLEPQRLKLEIAETVIAQGDSQSLLQLRRLRDLGVRVVIDHFGSGTSSLSMLAHVRAETIKIDLTFVSGQNGLTDHEGVLSALASLAHALGMDVVAQGIETADEQILATSAGCTRGQGHYLYPPMHADEVYFLLGRSENLR